MSRREPESESTLAYRKACWEKLWRVLAQPCAEPAPSAQVGDESLPAVSTSDLK
jgi:hypothetical protein